MKDGSHGLAIKDTLLGKYITLNWSKTYNDGCWYKERARTFKRYL